LVASKIGIRQKLDVHDIFQILRTESKVLFLNQIFLDPPIEAENC